jgi:hypothetical protein
MKRSFKQIFIGQPFIGQPFIGQAFIGQLIGQVLIGCLVLGLAASCAWPPSMIEDSAKTTPKHTKQAAPVAKQASKPVRGK